MTCVGVDLGGTRIKIGLVNEGGLAASRIIDSSPHLAFDQTLSRIKAEVKQLCNGMEKAAHIGFAFPGLVDTDKSTVIGVSGKYEAAGDVDLVAWAAKELGMELKLENDARLACLGEWRYGAGRGTNDLVFCTLGTGVGSSAIVAGRMLRGKHYQAGILGGHFIINYADSGHACSCGSYGCVESMASTWVMKAAAKSNVLYNSSLLKAVPEVDLAAVFDCSKQGDELALQLRRQCLDVWGAGIVNLIHAYDPEVVVIGGGVAKAKEILLPHFNQFVKTRAWTPWGAPELRIAEFPDTAAVLGAYLLFN